MATPLDIGLLQNVQVIFPFLLILVVTFAVLTKYMFKDKTGIAALIAFALAVMSISSNIVIKTINLMSPWFVLLVIFSLMVLLSYQAFGISEDHILSILKSKDYGIDFSYWMIALILIITIGSLVSVLSEEQGGVPGPGLSAGESGSGGYGTEGTKLVTSINKTGGQEAAFFNTIFHPKVLGMAVVLLIGMFTMSRLMAKD